MRYNYKICPPDLVSTMVAVAAMFQFVIGEYLNDEITPRPDNFRIFFQTPKGANHILGLLGGPLIRFKNEIKN